MKLNFALIGTSVRDGALVADADPAEIAHLTYNDPAKLSKYFNARLSEGQASLPAGIRVELLIKGCAALGFSSAEFAAAQIQAAYEQGSIVDQAMGAPPQLWPEWDRFAFGDNESDIVIIRCIKWAPLAIGHVLTGLLSHFPIGQVWALLRRAEWQMDAAYPVTGGGTAEAASSSDSQSTLTGVLIALGALAVAIPFVRKWLARNRESKGNTRNDPGEARNPATPPSEVAAEAQKASA